VVDLGLIYDVKIIDDWVGVKMTLTTPGCGMGGAIANQVRERILDIPGCMNATSGSCGIRSGARR